MDKCSALLWVVSDALCTVTKPNIYLFFSPLFPFSLSHSLPFPSLGDSHSDKALRLQPGQCYGEFTVEVCGLWKSQQLAWRAALCLLSNWGWVWAWGRIWVHQRRSWERVWDKWSCSLEKGYMIRTHSLNEVGSADKRVSPYNGTSLVGRRAWFPSHLWVFLDSLSFLSVLWGWQWEQALYMGTHLPELCLRRNKTQGMI